MAVRETAIGLEGKYSGPTVVEMEHLKKSFGNNRVLRDLSLVINRGRISLSSVSRAPASRFS